MFLNYDYRTTISSESKSPYVNIVYVEYSLDGRKGVDIAMFSTIILLSFLAIDF